MKKICFCIILFLFFSCFKQQNIKINKSNVFRLKNKYKKILIIPVYYNNDLIPHLDKKLSEMDFSDDFRKKFYLAVGELSRTINKEVEKIFFHGKYNLKTIVFSINNKYTDFIDKNIDQFEINNIKWPYNYNYNISKSLIINYIKNSEADCCLFNYIQVKKSNHTFKFFDSYLTLPIYKLFYKTLIFDRDGEILFETEPIAIFNLETYSLKSETENDQVFTTEQLSIDEIVKELRNKNKIIKLLRGDIDERGVYTDFLKK